MAEEDARKLSPGEWLGLIAVGCGAIALLTLFPILASSLRQAMLENDVLSNLTFMQRVLVQPVACVIGGIAATGLFWMATRKRYPFTMRRVLATTSLLIVFIFTMTFRSAANRVVRESARNENHVAH